MQPEPLYDPDALTGQTLSGHSHSTETRVPAVIQIEALHQDVIRLISRHWYEYHLAM